MTPGRLPNAQMWQTLAGTVHSRLLPTQAVKWFVIAIIAIASESEHLSFGIISYMELFFFELITFG